MGIVASFQFREVIMKMRSLDTLLHDYGRLLAAISLALLVDLKSFGWKEWWAQKARVVREAGFPENGRLALEPGK